MQFRNNVVWNKDTKVALFLNREWQDDLAPRMYHLYGDIKSSNIIDIII